LSGFENGYTEHSFLWVVNNINFQYFSILITLISAAVMVGVSYATTQPDYGSIKNLSFGTRTAEYRAESQASWSAREVLASVLVVVVIVGGYLYFTG